MGHSTNFTDAQLVGAMKPLLVHPNWEYLEEYLRREYAKQAHMGMRANETQDIFRAQGQCAALTHLSNLKPTLMEASQ